jgi:hypothetical protein
MALIDFRPLPEIPTGEYIVVFHQATSMVLAQKLHSPLIFTDETDQCSVPDSIEGFDFYQCYRWSSAVRIAFLCKHHQLGM